MKKNILIVILWLSFLFLLTGCETSDEKANKIFIQVPNLVEQGQKLEKENAIQAAKLYKSAVDKIDLIKTNHPSSNVAVQISQDVINLNGWKLSKLKEKISEIENFTDSLKNVDRFVELYIYRTYKEINFLKISTQFAKAGNFEAAIKYSRFLNDTENMLNSLIEVGIEYSKQGKVSKANEQFSTVENTGASIYDAAKGRVYGLLAGAYARVGNFEKAIYIIKRVQSEGKIEKDGKEYLSQYQNRGLIAIGTEYAKIGEFQKALEISQLSAKGNTSTIYDINSYKNYIYKSLLTQIGIEYAKQGNIDKAKSTIDDGCDKPFLVLTQIGLYYAKNNRSDEAKVAYDKSMTIANKADHPNSRAWNHYEMVSLFIEDGDYIRANNMIGYCKSHDFDFTNRILSEIAVKLASKGEIDPSIRNISWMSKSGGGEVAAVLIAMDNYLKITSRAFSDAEITMLKNIIDEKQSKS